MTAEESLERVRLLRPISETMLRSAVIGRYGYFVRQYDGPLKFHYEDERLEAEAMDSQPQYTEEVAKRIRAPKYVRPAKNVATILDLKGRKIVTP